MLEKTRKATIFPGFGEFLDASECAIHEKETISLFLGYFFFFSPLTPVEATLFEATPLGLRRYLRVQTRLVMPFSSHLST